MTGLIIFSAYSFALGSIFYYLKQPYNRHWWLKITTVQPQCVYYFGPFTSKKEAAANIAGYQADLEAEQAKVVEIKLNQAYPPAQLTFCPEEF
jgi:Domain of unknown function (DUF1816)